MLSNGSVYLGSGNDLLTLAAGSTLSVSNVETITGAAGADTITLGTAISTSTAVDLGAGSDKLTLAAVGSKGSLSNVETLTGGSGAADFVTLGAFANIATVTNTRGKRAGRRSATAGWPALPEPNCPNHYVTST
jgi:hypothetical protein